MACPSVRISRQWGNTNTAQFQGLGLRDRDICSSVATGANQAEEDFDSTLDIDLKGVFLCLKYEIEAMFKTGAVPLSIPLPLRASLLTRSAAYDHSKAASPEEIAGMVLLLASDLAGIATGGVYAVDSGQSAR